MVCPRLQRIDGDSPIRICPSNKNTKSKGTPARPQDSDRDYCYSCWIRGSKSFHQNLSPICGRHATRMARGTKALEINSLPDNAAEALSDPLYIALVQLRNSVGVSL